MDRVDELVLVGEAPVGGADPDSGMVGNIVERDLQPVLGEQLTTGDQQPLAIAGGVLAKFRFLHSAILASGYHPSEYLPISGSLSDGDHADGVGGVECQHEVRAVDGHCDHRGGRAHRDHAQFGPDDDSALVQIAQQLG